jgi:thymidylate synthase ThyX
MKGVAGLPYSRETYAQGPSAKVILDSLHPDGKTRLTTLEVVMHRFVLAEFNTHRVFSRNSASSRAIPVSKQIERIESNPAVPLSFPQEQSGMQGGQELEEPYLTMANEGWMHACTSALAWAKILHELGVHKSVVNRILEPYMWHTVIVSSTEWENFFDLRTNAQAQPEIRAVAMAMEKALYQSTPQRMAYGDWHLPFVSGYDYDDIMSIYHVNDNDKFVVNEKNNLELAKLCSAARCARVSYLTHEGNYSIEKDVRLAERLMKPPGGGPMHASPFEHVATPVNVSLYPWGNFKHFSQFRHELELSL